MPDLKAAAERILAGRESAEVLIVEARRLAARWLRENDDEPVTLDWLRTLWKVEPGHTKRESYVVARRGLFEVGWCPECGELPAAMALDRKIICKQPTRGEFRRLVAALAIREDKE
jgi:hypothetical protein